MNAISLRNTHSATVAAVLGSTRQVESIGTSFYNQDTWTVLWFLESLFNQRTRSGISQAVQTANSRTLSKKVIRIAATPDNLDARMVQVLLGGTYHEAWHSLWSCTRPLLEQEMQSLFDIPLVDQLWSYQRQFQNLINVLEDVRIEQLGRKQFPGSKSRLECLQDFILELEGSPQEIEKHDPFGFALCGIRDLGLDYHTVLSKQRMRSYLGSPYKGLLDSLAPQIHVAQNLTPDDVLGSVRIALECMPTLLPLLAKAPTSQSPKSPGEMCLSPSTALSDWADGVISESSLSWDDSNVVLQTREFTDPAWAPTLRAAIVPYTTYTKTQIRTLFKSWEQTSTVYGTATGKLSNRMLVDSAICLRSGLTPNRAYQQTDVQQDTSVAATILLDLSGSMIDHIPWLSEISATLLDSLVGIGAQVEVLGYEGGSGARVSLWTLGKFGEPVSSILPRLCALRQYVRFNESGTPTAMGLTWALASLGKRRETHRFVFVVTDGYPNSEDEEHIPRVVANPIPVIGIGVGTQAEFVTKTFPQSVWSPTVSDIPRMTVQKIKSLLRGR